MPTSPAAPRIAAILVAAGRGIRAGGGLPKQYRRLGGRSVLARSLALFAEHPRIDAVLAVIHADDGDLYAAAAKGVPKLVPPVAGGGTRQASGLAGLRALAPAPPDIVLIHDAARPFTSPALIDRAIDAALARGAAVPGLPVTDTVKIVDGDERVTGTPPRQTLRSVQTPQSFRFGLILQAHERAAAAGVDGLTDDGAVAEWAGNPLYVFEGEATNMKLTGPADFEAAERLFTPPLAALGDVRTGTGFDVHAVTEGDHVWLCGVRIPHERGLSGHSDADVGLHALTDAVLGAIGDGDIGAHFPPSDMRWKGASSDRFLAHAVGLVAARGGAVAHLDVTLLCEAPKIGPHREAMRARIAGIAGIGIERVGVKATTMETLGFVGRREGIAAMASATIRLPWTNPEAS
ncbi:bifunctional 2-C-methyl-D-erythritol 4-phosphate cytidylyltransferase/2-C-methyl-D-erythritol 2,4-cyclodiphosphate synthase [Labrys wisconsinensis]|uniref:Bifunctional enzyme IspD/IspF n=1 Tax=Labrys wisconsinensis TaxID=425677 RepID=A0ABU0J2F1_9HYPH|nr:bifunctional 2-C-methyl-D-erythritol 4-phosphate cytidylyltransferase/2-C-methyl-D-erythritol 2,4-cyclodiphosphate synthase [Labrys wisconsinensis]MDQ0468427.1 2-C-methyl-D-erythritol 4-phosphate cytidylyltransferase/2-C-methyl-D-erythritol 2,4-cyclodiphosphate synthase [Labrys wisconsinensis]